MVTYLLKNNFKLIFRNKLAVAMLLIGPLLTIMMLSNAFESMMKAYEAPESFVVGYRSESETISDNMAYIKSAGKEAGIELSEYPEGEPEKLINNNDLSAFVEFSEDSYTLYKSSDHKAEGAVAEYFFERVMNTGADTALDMIAQGAKLTSALPETEIEFMPAVNSTDYYGIIYILFFSCCGMICATGMLGSEKKHGIERKYQVCSLSPFALYMARLLPTVGVVAVCGIIETVITAVLFGIHWGSHVLSVLIVLLMITAFTALGLLFYSISGNLAITVIGSFAVIWILGHLGGSFETYMYSSFSDSTKLMTPFYHANRALVELSCMGHSDFVISSLLFSAALILICTFLAVLTDTLKRRCKA